MMMIAARAEECRSLKRGGDIEPHDAMVELDGLLHVRHLQVDVADGYARRRGADSAGCCGER